MPSSANSAFSSIISSPSKAPTTAPSSPPSVTMDKDSEATDFVDPTDDYAADFDPSFANDEEKALYEADLLARQSRQRNEEEERRIQKKAQLKKAKKSVDTPAERERKAKQLNDLLEKSSAFGQILTKKTEVLGKVGSGFDGQSLKEAGLVMETQPKCMTGGTMRDYQLEGLTWMYAIGGQGISGILADEMGLGKTIQTISLLAKYREVDYHGPFLIIAPLSTLSNWMQEFEKWCPTLPVTMYHGTPPQRREIMRTQLKKNYKNNKVNKKFPIVVTTPEIVMNDAQDLVNINWENIFIDEGHRLKNSDSKLFRTLITFKSYTRFLITGTPLQNSLKELWSLLHFLMPRIFQDWEQFESWFDFSDLQDEEGTESFLKEKENQELIKKMHRILQPLLLRRIKADVEHLLPKKREYILYAPLTKDQTDLYNAINDKKIDTRQFLEDKVIERLTKASDTAPSSRISTPAKQESSDSEDIPLSKLAIKTKARGRPLKSTAATPTNAFKQMMQNRVSSASASPAPSSSRKRKSTESLNTPAPKSAKSSRASTPTTSIRGRKVTKRKTYTEGNSDDEDALSDDEFEAKLAEEMAAQNQTPVVETDPEEAVRLRIIELAKKEISNKKLGNPIMQLRLVCNSPHNFYNPYSSSTLPPTEDLVTSSGKMLLLDRLLPHLFAQNSKVLIFSQFKTQLDILEDYARDLRRWNVCRIDGSVAQQDRRDQIKLFNEDPEYKLFLLSTRAGGQGINLASADTVILYDSDWNPQQDLQAQDRAHRIGQKNPVIIYRLATKGTVEEELLLSADAKRRLEKLVIKKGGFRDLKQKLPTDVAEADEEAALRALMLKDGEVFRYRGGERILSDKDLEVLTDRSPEAYGRAERGEGDSQGGKMKFRVVETKVSGLMLGMERKGEREGR